MYVLSSMFTTVNLLGPNTGGGNVLSIDITLNQRYSTSGPSFQVEKKYVKYIIVSKMFKFHFLSLYFLWEMVNTPKSLLYR